jgi:hypothetical protein
MQIPRKAVLSLFAVCLAGATTAWAGKAQTAPGKYTNWGDDEFDVVEILEPFKFADFASVSLAPLDVSHVPSLEGGAAKDLQKALAGCNEAFLKGVRNGVKDFSKTPVAAEEPQGKALVIKAAVVDLNPGSKAARGLIGYGSGAARAKVSGEILDAATGKVLVRFTHEKRAGSGMLGAGSSSQLMLKSTERAGADIGRLFKAF